MEIYLFTRVLFSLSSSFCLTLSVKDLFAGFAALITRSLDGRILIMALDAKAKVVRNSRPRMNPKGLG